MGGVGEPTKWSTALPPLPSSPLNNKVKIATQINPHSMFRIPPNGLGI